jgi:leucyl/phenylalanyl-tRNA---protein transferase
MSMKDAFDERLTPERREQFRRGQDKAKILSARALGTVSQAVDRVALDTGIVVNARPSAAEVVANYGRGQLLFGMRNLGTYRWQSFPERAVITPDSAKVPKRFQTQRRKLDYEVRFGEDVDAIIDGCRDGRDGWLTDPVTEVYREIGDLGCLSTVGTYKDGALVGGLWGIAVGGTFGIMSMFHVADHAGSVALAALSDAVAADEWVMADCGWLNENFRRYGAHEIPTAEFCELFWRGITDPPRGPEPA